MKKYIKSAVLHIEDESYSVQLDFARDPNTRPKILDKLADDTDIAIRLTVAINPNTSLETLKKLAESTSVAVRAKVCRNPNTPLDIIEKLIDEDNDIILEEATLNANLPSNLLKKISDKLDTVSGYNIHDAILNLIAHPNVTLPIVHKYAAKAMGYDEEIQLLARKIIKQRFLK